MLQRVWAPTGATSPSEEVMRSLEMLLRFSTLLSAVVLLLPSCTRVPPGGVSTGNTTVIKPGKPGASMIRVDDAHNAFATEGSILRYNVAPSSTLILDTTGYTLKAWPNRGVAGKDEREFVVVDPIALDPEVPTPNAVHVVEYFSGEYDCERENWYRTEWKWGQPIVLNAATLRCIRGREEFSGFQAGQLYHIEIGRDELGERTTPVSCGEVYAWESMWLASIIVVEDPNSTSAHHEN